MPEIRQEGNRVIIDLSAGERLVIEDEQLSVEAKVSFRQLPNWANWTPTEARDYVQNSILDGLEQAGIDAWIDANVTSLAAAKIALKRLAGGIIATRGILKNIAIAIIYFRRIVVRRS